MERSSPRLRFAVTGAVALGAAMACGSGPSESLGGRGGSWSAPTPAPVDLQGAFLVPPDRALTTVELEATAADFAGAAAGARAEEQALRTALSDAPGCALRVVGYGPPAAGSGVYTARMQLVVDADLTGATAVPERMDAVDRCAAAVGGRLAYQVERGGAKVTLGASEAVWTVDEPQRHLAELVARWAADAAGYPAVGAGPLHPEDLRCVPQAAVSIGRRTVAGVELVLPVSCRTPEPGEG